MSKAVKIKTYGAKVKPSVVYGSAAWGMIERYTKRLGAWEKKILRTHGPVAERGNIKNKNQSGTEGAI